MKATIKDPVDLAEESFFDSQLLETVYFKKYRTAYYFSKKDGLLNPYRNYLTLINYLDEINQYNKRHSSSFIKRIKAQSNDWKACEAVISEVIVYNNSVVSG